ncbi:MAG TPA: hypothetical protein VF690_10500 [Hymenobacter sp.]|jgi:hypothetical protein
MLCSRWAWTAERQCFGLNNVCYDESGNLRLAYRAPGRPSTYTATLEQDTATHRRESQQFDSLSVSPPSSA